MLFLPENTPNMLINGSCLGADAVILDPEDAVFPPKRTSHAFLCNTIKYISMFTTRPSPMSTMTKALQCRLRKSIYRTPAK